MSAGGKIGHGHPQFITEPSNDGPHTVPLSATAGTGEDPTGQCPVGVGTGAARCHRAAMSRAWGWSTPASRKTVRTLRVTTTPAHHPRAASCTTSKTSTHGGKTAGWLPRLRWIYSPHLRGCCPRSRCCCLGPDRRHPRPDRRRASSVAIGVAGVVAHPARARRRGRERRSHNRDPSGRPHTHPPRICWGQCGDGG